MELKRKTEPELKRKNGKPMINVSLVDPVKKKAYSELMQEKNRVTEWLAENMIGRRKIDPEFINAVLMEIMFQCMGKIPVLLKNKQGKDILFKTFEPRYALEAVKALAELNGQEIKKIIELRMKAQVESHETKQITFQSDDERTAEVLRILSDAGAIKPRAEQFDDAQVVEILPS